MAGFATTTRIFDGVMYIVVVVAGALFLINGTITTADYIRLPALRKHAVLTSIRRIVEFTEQFQNGMTGIERFCHIMDEPPDIADAPDATELTDVRGDVTFDHVSFRYNDNEHTVLADVNLNVKAGERVALVGPSGSGKTTLCNLIPRFYNLTGGRILIDGKDITTLTQRSLRESIGMVQQDVYMFSGTVLRKSPTVCPAPPRSSAPRRAARGGGRVYLGAAGGVCHVRGERGVKLSAAEAARLHRARVPQKPAHPHSGRGDQRLGQRKRTPCAAVA